MSEQDSAFNFQKRWVWIIPALVVAVVVLAFAFSRAQSTAPIRIGVLMETAAHQFYASTSILQAVTLAVDELNREGGLLGRRVEIVSAQVDEKMVDITSAVTRLIESDKVSAVFGCETTLCRKAVEPVLEKNDQILFFPAQYEGVEQSPNIIYSGAVPTQRTVPALAWAINKFGKRVYFVGTENSYSSLVFHVIRDLAKAFQIDIVGEYYFGLNDTDATAFVNEINIFKPDLIVNTLLGVSNEALFSALAANVTTTPVLSANISEREIAAYPMLAKYKQHYAALSYMQSDDREINRQFVDNWKRRFGENSVVSEIDEAMYDSIKVWAGAVRDANTEVPREVNRTVARQSIEAPSGRFAVDAGTRHAWRGLRIGRLLENGQFEQVYKSETILRPAPFPNSHPKDEWLQEVLSGNAEVQ